MLEHILEGIEHAGLDCINLIPFLFVTYVLMEYIEHKMGDKTKAAVKKAGNAGPVAGALVGIIPQCGFSTVASNLYAGRIITLGTLFAVFLSTSDEMLPIMISESVSMSTIGKILLIKCITAMIAGFLIDAVLRIRKKTPVEQMMDGHMCEHEHCHCETGIFRSALIHTVHITIFIFLITFVLTLVIHHVGEDALKGLFSNRPIVSSFLAGVVGLIPNCAASVVITELYLEQVISAGALFSGLLVGAGVGLLVLFRVNEHWKENVKILALLYATGVVAGIVIEWILQAAGIALV